MGTAWDCECWVFSTHLSTFLETSTCQTIFYEVYTILGKKRQCQLEFAVYEE